MLKIAVALIAATAVLALIVRVAEARFAFFPIPGETATPRHFGVDFEAFAIATRDGEQLRGWALAPPAAAAAQPTRRAHILYFHGNGGNLSIWAPILAGIARQGHRVVAFDYRGYGQSSGRPTERGLYRDVDAILGRFWADPQVDRPVVYWGRSLGGTMAAYAASVKPPDGLILESSFPDVRTLLRGSPLALLGLFSSYRFPATEHLRAVTAPTLVMHGDNDHVIPIRQGQALFEAIAGPKRFVTIQAADHNDAAPPDPRTYWQSVDEFIAGL